MCAGVKNLVYWNHCVHNVKMVYSNSGYMKKINFLDVICVLFAVLFVYASVSKLMAYDEFKAQIGKSPLILHHEWWIAWFIPSLEIVIAALLFIPRLQLIGLYGCFALMFIFSIYIAFMLVFTPNLPCSCGGVLNKMGWEGHLIFNIGFMLLAVVGIVLWNREKRREDLIAQVQY
jgi:uncharacterized membrane protein YphA (DoxX/SURF4 family)